MFTSNRQIDVTNTLGLHLRAADKFVRMAQQFRANVSVICGGQRACGKSILDLAMLAAGCGSRLELQNRWPRRSGRLGCTGPRSSGVGLTKKNKLTHQFAFSNAQSSINSRIRKPALALAVGVPRRRQDTPAEGAAPPTPQKSGLRRILVQGRLAFRAASRNPKILSHGNSVRHCGLALLIEFRRGSGSNSISRFSLTRSHEIPVTFPIKRSS